MKKFILGLALLTGIGASAQCDNTPFTYGSSTYYVSDIVVSGTTATFYYIYENDPYGWNATYNYETNCFTFAGVACIDEASGDYYFPGDPTPVVLSDELSDCLNIDDFVSCSEASALLEDSLNAEIATLTAQYNAAQGDANACNDNAVLLNAEIATLTDQYNAAQGDANACNDAAILLNAEIANLNDSINGLEFTIAQQAQVLNITQFALDNCFDNVNDADAQNAALNQENIDLQSQLDSLQALLDVTTDELVASNATNDSLETVNATQAASIVTLTDVVLGLNDQLNDVTADFGTTVAELEEDILVLENNLSICQGTLSDCSDAVAYNNALYNECTDANTALSAELATAEDEVMYWMDAYNAAVTECNTVIDGLNQEIGLLEGSVENLIDDVVELTEECAATATSAYQNGYDYGYETGLLQCADIDVDDIYDLGYENGLTDADGTLCEYNYGDVMEAYYNGYAQGLDDCDGTTGIDILDPSGQVLTQVVGYYNELGQIVDPRTYTGVIIRRHADGTFSKYYVAR